MVDQSGMISTIAGTGNCGYSGDVPFDFQKYPHMGPPRPFSTREGQFVKSYHDIVFKYTSTTIDNLCEQSEYEPAKKKKK